MMDKKTAKKLRKTIEICESILNDEPFHASDSEISLIPRYLDAMSPTGAKKLGLVLKRGATPIGTCQWQLPGGGKASGEIYLGSKFKSK